ncbi:hypothetical protein D0T53_10580 [Dysgonomonas sp. 216]|uniref:hypothetical protein n=1 Tax=Dysgonomonas sp. 216 TaxID=2302934 RepID=UPI0013D802F4|nr:hypothetical protein [Dysgonomonas sp. 216]NDW19353.1 hypothetical protein [Dysgonomonas sp. 216]
MRKHFKYALCALAGIIMLSCIDSDYDIDDINTDSHFKIPTVPFGNIDTIWIETLPEIPIPPIEIPLEEMKVAKKEILPNIFTKDIIDKFFNENAKENVVFEGTADVKILTEDSGLNIEVKFEVVDESGYVIDAVKIPNQYLEYGKDQGFKMIFPRQYFGLMQNAKDINIIFILSAERIHLTYNDFVFIKDIKLKSGGIHFDF